MLKCKTLDLGFDVFKCPNCGKEKFCFHTCKSRLCSSCGNKYTTERQTSIFLNYLNLNIDMLFGLFLKNLEITLEKIDKDYHFYLKQVKSL